MGEIDLSDVRWAQIDGMTERVRGWLSTITYKPGWTFEARPSSSRFYPGVLVIIKAEVVDSYHPEKMFPLTVQAIVNELCTDNRDHFMRWLSDHLHKIEIHESREWLKVDGALYDDPHAGDPGRL